MKEYTIGKNDAGQRLDRWLAKTLPVLPAPLAQKYIRLKRVKVNGKGSKRDVRLQVGDLLQLYISDPESMAACRLGAGNAEIQRRGICNHDRF